MTTSKTCLDRSFRIVCVPRELALVEALLNEEGFRFEPEPFSPLCRKLLHAPFPLGSSLAAFFGFIYIQNRSSMLPPLALAPAQGSAVLDMAASPGSKSGFLAQICGSDGFVLANEPGNSRLQTLRTNLACANLLQTATCSYPGETLPLEQDSWPYVLLDPPCSGWGTGNSEAKRLWRSNKILPLIALQRKLLAHAASLLVPGGRLLYSTCTTNPAENEAQTKFATEELGLEAVPIPAFPGFTYAPSLPGCLLVDGQASNAQGFYLSLLKKPGSALKTALFPSATQFASVPRNLLCGPLSDPAYLPGGETAAFGDKIYFLPQEALLRLSESFRWRGFLLGKFHQGDFQPWPRLRALLPRPENSPEAPRIVIDEVSALRSLLAGHSEMTSLARPKAALWWRGLPLGTCQIRNGRIIANFPR